LGDVDPQGLADLARRYAKLRRSYWRFFFGGIVVFVVLATVLIAFGVQEHSGFHDMLVVTLALGFLICCLGGFVDWHLLMHLKLQVSEHPQIKTTSPNNSLIEDL
jgi:hypothetical protein